MTIRGTKGRRITNRTTLPVGPRVIGADRDGRDHVTNATTTIEDVRAAKIVREKNRRTNIRGGAMTGKTRKNTTRTRRGRRSKKLETAHPQKPRRLEVRADPKKTQMIPPNDNEKSRFRTQG
jgi:hypothetical protein